MVKTKRGGNVASKEITVVISYNDIENRKSGWYEGKRKRVFVHANDAGDGSSTGRGDDGFQRATSVMAELKHGMYHIMVPYQDVVQYVIYAGLYAMDGALQLARSLRELAPVAKISVYACECDWEKKQDFLACTNIALTKCGCGGRKDLGQLVTELVRV